MSVNNETPLKSGLSKWSFDPINQLIFFNLKKKTRLDANECQDGLEVTADFLYRNRRQLFILFQNVFPSFPGHKEMAAEYLP